MKKVLVIVGPTGIGKSELAISLAEKLNGEIISGDSIQVYRELNIGSAKVSKTQQKNIPHHLINILNIEESYSVASFQKMGRELIEEITLRNKLPIIAGGTGLYIKALLYDYMFLNEAEDKLINALVNKMSNQELYDELLKVDPLSLDKIHINNRQRLIRAVIFHRQLNEKKSDVIAKQKQELLYDTFLIGLTLPRDILYENINKRVEKMIDLGLEAEVRNIIKEDLSRFQLLGLQGIGYKEWLPYFKDEITLDEVINTIQKHSRNLAKRQYTWFNNQMNINWYNKNELNEELLLKEVKVWL